MLGITFIPLPCAFAIHNTKDYASINTKTMNHSLVLKYKNTISLWKAYRESVIKDFKFIR